MKKSLVLFLLALALVSAAIAAEAPLGVGKYTSVDEIATTISSFFPKVQGEITSVQGNRLTIGLGAKDGLQNGVTLTLWRDGKEILHPVTHAVIGRAEDEVGTVEVTAVEEKTSFGIVMKKLREPRVGDKARITPKKISIALIPIGAENPEIIQGLAQRLAEFGRFSVLDNEKTAAFLKDRKQRDSALVKEMGKTFSLDVVAAIEVFPTDGKFLVTTRVFYTDDARPLDTIVALLDLRTKKDALGEVRPFFAPTKEVKTATASAASQMPLDSQLFAAADLEGTGKLQYVLSDGMKVHIYQQESSGWKERWAERGVYTAEEMQIFNLDVADINGNGRPEIFVTCMHRGRVVSYVIEYKDGAYTRIADIPGFLRVVRHPRTGNMLIGQGYDPEKFYAGPPKQYGWSDNNYVLGAELTLPRDLTLYGFTYADLGEGGPMIVALDENEQLIVYSNNVPIWKSEEKYPAVGVTVRKPVTGIDATLQKDAVADDKRYLVNIPGRVFAQYLNADGRDEIVLPKNSGKTLLTPHKRAELIGLVWTGSRLEERWRIKEDTGAVQDFQVLRLEGGGAQIVALVRHPGGLFRSDRMSIMTFEMK